jgi:hypothetical protein
MYIASHGGAFNDVTDNTRDLPDSPRGDQGLRESLRNVRELRGHFSDASWRDLETPVSTNLILSCVAERVLGLPRSY